MATGNFTITQIYIAIAIIALIIFSLSMALLLRRRPKAASNPQPAAAVVTATSAIEPSWLMRVRQGLTKTRETLQQGLRAILPGAGPIDEATLEGLHELLFRSDLGARTVERLIKSLRESVRGQNSVDLPTICDLLRQESLAIFAQAAAPLKEPVSPPRVILIVGVNGVGKTTSIGKLASYFVEAGQKVLLCAADTYRAAAIEQLSIWAERIGVDIVKNRQGSDPASVVFDATKAAVARKVDTLLVDTAGQLHNKKELMDELGKINAVMKKELASAPHETWLVLDATTGQNGINQVKAFMEVVNITGLIVTKLDGTAKGGILIGIADQFKLPIYFIGVGEKATDLREFNAKDYVDSIFDASTSSS